MTRYYYIIPKVDFFLQGRGGAVSHVVGIFNGLADNGVAARVDGCLGVENYIPESGLISRYKRSSRQLWLDDLVNALSVMSYYSNKEGVILHFRKTWSLVLAITLRPFKYRRIKRRNKVVFEVNGLSLESRKDVFGRLLFKINAGVTAKILNMSDLVYVVSPSIRNELLSSGCRAKIAVIPNGSPKYIGEVLDVSGPPGVVFYGKFRAYNEFEVLREAFIKLREKWGDAKLYIIGFGPEQNNVDSIFSGVPGVSVHGEMDLIGVKSIISGHAGPVCGVVPVKNDLGSSYLSPIKLYDYFSVGVPAVVSNVVAVDQFLKDNMVVSEYSAGDSSSMVDAISEMLDRKKYSELQNEVRRESLLTGWSA